MTPPHSDGEVTASGAGGGAMSCRVGEAYDPSVGDYADTSPSEWGGKV
jgi:hypothetical protein